MGLPKTSIITGDKLNIGKHRLGVGLIPLGDRNRVTSTTINLVGTAEEVDVVDRFESYNKRR